MKKNLLLLLLPALTLASCGAKTVSSEDMMKVYNDANLALLLADEDAKFQGVYTDAKGTTKGGYERTIKFNGKTNGDSTALYIDASICRYTIKQVDGKDVRTDRKQQVTGNFYQIFKGSDDDHGSIYYDAKITTEASESSYKFQYKGELYNEESGEFKELFSTIFAEIDYSALNYSDEFEDKILDRLKRNKDIVCEEADSIKSLSTKVANIAVVLSYKDNSLVKASRTNDACPAELAVNKSSVVIDFKGVNTDSIEIDYAAYPEMKDGKTPDFDLSE